ncbi:Flp pilus assembly protein RcpC/CpaB [Rubellimicrobium mesophilum DSM 19309]|uniref:Flp pilus assembly protein RcpC/CpaB n=1 Tax=Rubellimicrobium mesophilum DSM 19309 TaxID=442562 RepID=A0A017HVR3_9RHOB|nr:Flp pilus assembly protein CpaB [Rubellimicrobium mesophilum]EYD77849.1 Flp pilus assembly protein RcpC/CpaB [Rubellimicrobium mesophilum DSM 19309]
MKLAFGLVFVAGLGLAGSAVWMVRDHFQQQSMALAQVSAAAAAMIPTVEVWAVKREMAYGEPITMDDVQPIQYAEPFLPEGVFRTQEELFPKGPDETRVVLRQMEPNEPILAVKVTEPGEDAGLTSRLGKGMRAFAISVDVASGVSGFLRPGDKVDVYWTGTIDEGADAGRQVTRLIEPGLSLIAIDQTADEDIMGASIARTVTVQVTPQQVADLAQAQASGSLSLSLVGQGDEVAAAGVIEVDQRSLLDIQDAPAPVVAPEAPAPRVCTVRTRKGDQVIETPVDCPPTN